MSTTYDRRAGLYDAVVGSSLYLKVFWGTSPRSNTDFARQALASAGIGRFAEIGCGSLLFTSRIYDDMRAASATLVDRARPMLDRGQKRLEKGKAPMRRIELLHADATRLPIADASFDAVLSLNLLHVVPEPARVISECWRVLKPGGRLFVSVLVKSGRWSDAWLASLHRAGELGPPMTLDDLRRALGGTIESQQSDGNLAFVVARRG